MPTTKIGIKTWKSSRFNNEASKQAKRKKGFIVPFELSVESKAKVLLSLLFAA